LNELVVFICARAGEHEASGGPRAQAEAALYRAIADDYDKSVRSLSEGLSVPARRLAVAAAAIWSDHPDYVQDWPLGSARHRHWH
jgi:hypothetical protein